MEGLIAPGAKQWVRAPALLYRGAQMAVHLVDSGPFPVVNVAGLQSLAMRFSPYPLRSLKVQEIPSLELGWG